MKSSLLNLGMAILMAAGMSACAPGLQTSEDGAFASTMDDYSLLKTGYQEMQDEGVQSNPVEPLGPIDATNLTDDQVVQAFKDRLLNNLENLKKAIANAKAAGKDVSRIEGALPKIEKLTEKLIDRLDTDADFRAQVIAQIRKAKPAGAGGQPRSPLSGSGQSGNGQNQAGQPGANQCQTIKKILDAGRISGQAKDQMTKNYEQNCKSN